MIDSEQAQDMLPVGAQRTSADPGIRKKGGPTPPFELVVSPANCFCPPPTTLQPFCTRQKLLPSRS